MTSSDADLPPLGPVVDALCAQALKLAGPRSTNGRLELPSRDVVIACVEGLRAAFFPGYVGTSDLHDEGLHYYVGATLDRTLRDLEEQVQRGLAFMEAPVSGSRDDREQRAYAIIRKFAQRLPEVRALVASDVEAAYEGDPALVSRDEAIFSYPGILAVTYQRVAHELYLLGVPLIPRMMTEHAHSITGIDIHPGATIGERFFIDHGTGVVVGETAILGRNVRLYQGVTLGAKSFPLDANGHPIKGIARHPVVEDDVIVYAGATILGRITVGRGASIGGNVWVTNSVPPGGRVTQAATREQKFEGGEGI